MKDDPLEKATAEFLQAAFSCPVARHPRGNNHPPDILLGNSIAVEVTRLAKQVLHEGKKHSLETYAPKIRDSFRNAVTKAQNNRLHGQSYFVSLKASFPHYNKFKHGAEISHALSELTPLSAGKIQEIIIDDHVKLRITLASRLYETTFRVGGVNFTESGGWVLTDLVEQTQWALDRKISNVSGIFTEYTDWWLAVGSHLTLSLNDEGIDFATQHLQGRNVWSKVILVDQLNLHQSKIIDLKT